MRETERIELDGMRYVSTADGRVESYRNLLRAGLEERYIRANWVRPT